MMLSLVPQHERLFFSSALKLKNYNISHLAKTTLTEFTEVFLRGGACYASYRNTITEELRWLAKFKELQDTYSFKWQHIKFPK